MDIAWSTGKGEYGKLELIGGLMGKECIRELRGGKVEFESGDVMV